MQAKARSFLNITSQGLKFIVYGPIRETKRGRDTSFQTEKIGRKIGRNQFIMFKLKN